MQIPWNLNNDFAGVEAADEFADEWVTRMGGGYYLLDWAPDGLVLEILDLNGRFIVASGFVSYDVLKEEADRIATLQAHYDSWLEAQYAKLRGTRMERSHPDYN